MPDVTLQLAVVAAAMSIDPRQAATQARSLGFAGILFDAVSPALNLLDLSVTGRREFRHVLSAAGQSLVGLRAELGPRGFSPGSDVDRILAHLDPVLETSAGLGARLVTIDLGPLPPASRAAAPKPKITREQAGLILLPEMDVAPAPAEPADAPDPAFVAQLDAALSDLAARADRYGTTVAISASLASFASLDQALRRVRAPLFGVDLDPVSLLRDEDSLDAVFSMIGPLIRHVRARDASVGESRRTKPMPISRGDTKWGQLLDALRDADYAGWITVDPMELTDRTSGARAAIKYLREVAV